MNIQNTKLVSAPELFAGGFTAIIPVLPPNAKPLHPGNLTKMDPVLLKKTLGKAPGELTKKGWRLLYDWPEYEATLEKARHWQEHGANTGLRMGDRFVALDLDLDDPGVCSVAMRAIPDELQQFVRSTGGAKQLLLFRVKGDPIPKTSKQFTINDERHLVEVLGVGSQAVVLGTHPSGKPYQWWRRHIAEGADALHEITGEEMAELVAKVSDALANELGAMPGKGTTRDTGGTAASVLGAVSLSPETTEEIIPLLENNDDWDEWYLTIALAVAGALGEAGREAFHAFSRKSSKYDTENTDAEYNRALAYSGGKIGAGTINTLAKEQGLLDADRRAKIAQSIKEFKADKAAEKLAEAVGHLTVEDRSQLAEMFNLGGDLSANYVSKEEHAQTAQVQSTAPAAPPAEPPTKPRRTGFQHPPGLVGALTDFGYKCSSRDTRINALAGALMSVAALSKNRWVVVSQRHETPLNLQIVVLAKSGVGKEDARNMVLRKCSHHDDISLPDYIPSEAGAHAELLEAPNVVWMCDEYGRYLEKYQKNVGGNERDVMRFFMQNHTRAMGKIPKRTYSEKSRNKAAVPNPFLNCLHTSTPDAVFNGMTSNDVVDGVLGRQLVLFEKRRPSLRDADTVEFWRNAPMALADACKRITDAAANPSGQLLHSQGGATMNIITFTPDALETVKKTEAGYDKFAEEMGEVLSPLWMRAQEQTLRVAGVVALGVAAMDADPTKVHMPTITAEVWGYAAELVCGRILALRDSLEEVVVDGEGSVIYQAIARRTKELPADDDGYVPVKNILLSVKGRGRSYDAVKRELQSMIETGALVQKEEFSEKGDKYVRTRPWKVRLS